MIFGFLSNLFSCGVAEKVDLPSQKKSLEQIGYTQVVNAGGFSKVRKLLGQ